MISGKPAYHQIFCAFCKIPRRIYSKKNASWTNVVIALVLGCCLEGFFGNPLNFRSLIYAVLILVMIEIGVSLRRRWSLNCPHCGFDPKLYMRDRARAAEQVRFHLEELRNSGEYLLKRNNPFAQLPKRKAPPPIKATVPQPNSGKALGAPQDNSKSALTSRIL